MLQENATAQSLIAALCDIATMIDRPRRMYALTRIPYEDFYEHRVWKERRNAAQTLWRLKRAKYVQDKKVGKKLYISLTEKGAAYAVLRCMSTNTGTLPKGRFCIVSFDIPETQRRIRVALRSVLRQLKFRRVHHSLWISNLNYAQHLKYFIHLNGADRWISIFVGEKAIYTKSPAGRKV